MFYWSVSEETKTCLIHRFLGTEISINCKIVFIWYSLRYSVIGAKTINYTTGNYFDRLTKVLFVRNKLNVKLC